jgi:hypothetical protein
MIPPNATQQQQQQQRARGLELPGRPPAGEGSSSGRPERNILPHCQLCSHGISHCRGETSGEDVLG